MSVNNFDSAFDKLMKFEGGYVNDLNDQGGETNFGISKRSYPDLNIKALTEDHAKSIYYDDYWLKYKCDELASFPKNKDVAIKFFDMCVNMGPKQATSCLQRALRALNIDIKDDGIIGPLTIQAVNDCPDSSALVACMKCESAGLYRILAVKSPLNKKFLDGWLNRAYL